MACQRLGSDGALARCFWRLAKNYPAVPRGACQCGRGARAPRTQMVAIEKFAERSAVYQFTAVFTATGPEIDQIICGANDLFLMLDYQQSVAPVAQIVHYANELPDIARVQANARFVHNKESVDKRCSEARGKVHALDFAAAQRARRAIEREIADADLAEIVQACADFVTQHLSGFVVAMDVDAEKKSARIGNRQRLKLGKGEL